MTQSTQVTLVVTSREPKNTKQADKIPANIFGLKQDSQAISLDRKSFTHFLEFEYQGGVVYLQVGEKSKKEPVLVDEVQNHPYKKYIQHVSLRRVNLKEKLEVTVPIEMIGESEVSDAEVVLTQYEMQVSALPTNIPEAIQVDISGIKDLDDRILFKDLVAPEGCELIYEEEMAEQPIVIVREHKEEVEAVAPEDAVGSEETTEGGSETPSTGDNAETE